MESIFQSDGTILASWAPTERYRDTVVISDKECDLLFSHAEQEEIGSVAFKHSFLARRIAVTYVLPPTSLEQLDQLIFRRADANPSSVAQPNSLPLEFGEQSPVKTDNATATSAVS